MFVYATPPMKNLTTQQVVLYLGLALIGMTGVVVLALAHQDVGAIFTSLAVVFGLIMGALGINLKHSMDQVKDISNGRLSEQIAKNDTLNDKIAAMNDKLTAMAVLVQAQTPKGPDE